VSVPFCSMSANSALVVAVVSLDQAGIDHGGDFEAGQLTCRCSGLVKTQAGPPAEAICGASRPSPAAHFTSLAATGRRRLQDCRSEPRTYVWIANSRSVGSPTNNPKVTKYDPNKHCG
jgi:hypothetical protein